jgi:NTE family protein
MSDSKDIALVLSSGGDRGFAHIGVINVLEKHGFNITSIAGTSMGALVGGFYATGMLKHFEEWAVKLDKLAVLKLVDITISSNGIMKGEKLIKELESLIPERNIEDLNIPFCAIATDIMNEKEIVFRSGKLYDAIRASIAIPTVLKPHKIENLQLIDGGVLNPIPSNRIQRNKRDLLVVSNVNGRSSKEKPFNYYQEIKTEIKLAENKSGQAEEDQQFFVNILKKLNKLIPSHNDDRIGYFNLFHQSTGLMLQTLSDQTNQAIPPDLLIDIPRSRFGTFDFYKAKDIIHEGEIFAETALKDAKLI